MHAINSTTTTKWTRRWRLKVAHYLIQLTMTMLRLLAGFVAVACFVPIFLLIHLDLLYFVNQLCYLQYRIGCISKKFFEDRAENTSNSPADVRNTIS